jgi:hypothetical protein
LPTVLKTTRLSEEFNYEAYQLEYADRALKLAAIDTQGQVTLFTTNNNIKPKSDWRIVSLITGDKKVDPVFIPVETNKDEIASTLTSEAKPAAI